METRRSFLKKASLLAGSTALSSMIPHSILRATSINAAPGSTYLDAEHIVFLMQENRSFDHCYGSLKGVRGFNDPRAINLPNGLPVWFQQNKKGQIFPPFRLDIKNTKSTWMGSLPHSWRDMVDARNFGKMDNWLEAKKAGNPAYQPLPLTMGYYDRSDIPFYYALADAFTVCDQHFCSTLTGTSSNRSYFWSATIREDAHNPKSLAHVNNGQINYKDVNWKTYPERLEEAGISWGVYQNEVSIPIGLESENENWLANFTDNNLEFSKQYNIRFHPPHRIFMKKELDRLLQLEKSGELKKDEIIKTKQTIEQLLKDIEFFSEANFEKLSDFEKNIHRKAFITNIGDPNYHELEEIELNGTKVSAPKGDIFHQFRKDVNEDKLPTVSWLVAPCNFSDHPGAPWFGAWYVSEALDILTKNPEVWKKTIFILTYDENDGYFDHIPPFVAPLPDILYDGATTDIPTEEEFVDEKDNLGLGFRVPMVIASPWTKGGFVSSEVFDLTSNLQFLEHFIEKKTGKKVIEENLGAWRRAVCGNLTSVFRTADEKPTDASIFIDRNETLETIFSARDKKLPGDFKEYKESDLKNKSDLAELLPKQEPGTKSACPIPYNLGMNFSVESNEVKIEMNCWNAFKTSKIVSAPFQLYDSNKLKEGKENPIWNFTVKEGKKLNYSIPQSSNSIHLKGFGPNGFFREFIADSNKLPNFSVKVNPISDPLHLQILISNPAKEKLNLRIVDNSYKQKTQKMKVSETEKEILLDVTSTKGWYDFSLKIEEVSAYELRFAGHVENGKVSITDPLMGGEV